MPNVINVIFAVYMGGKINFAPVMFASAWEGCRVRRLTGPVKSTRQTELIIMLKRFLKNEDGATAIEYGLIAALIGVAIIVAVTSVGTGLNGTFNDVAAKLG
jgi:pilus assembly protein Flp/PilA